MSNISRFIGNERGDKICHEDDGCPTELAVLKRFWREQQASTLPEEVANLVELLDEEEVPYEDSLGVALSLTGRTKQYANGKTATLREQVEKLTEESVVLRASSRSKLETISSLELQVEKLTMERDDLRSRRCEVCGYLEHDLRASNRTKLDIIAYLASPVLNRIRAEGMRMAADICSEKHSLSGAEEAIRARAAELEKTNA